MLAHDTRSLERLVEAVARVVVLGAGRQCRHRGHLPSLAFGDDRNEVALLEPRAGGPGTRCTVPAAGAVIVDSIFIASSVAIGSPRLTVSPAATSSDTIPVTGAATWPAWFGSARSICAPVASMDSVADVDGSQLAVDAHEHGAHAAVVGLADRFELEEQPHAGGEVDGELFVSRSPRKNAGVGISETSPNCSRAAAKSFAGPGNRISASAARRGAPGCCEPLGELAVELARGVGAGARRRARAR